ncbi:hypothetical protein JCGZ_00654 [Jatropha curcas]|uniref:Uncharacterized protein n=1 Tax=Jatropha curcas TaxID=180498 RepID=A0A067JDG2_JATCU|nr:hypothetical protein JCGZ_00654 [Jatropha curcas]
MKLMDEISVVLKRFGDEQSNLLDQFERLSFEVQLNQAILGRSLSEPGTGRPRYIPPTLNGGAPPPLVTTEGRQGRRRQGRRRHGSGFNKVLKKLFKPMFGRRKGMAKSNGDETEVPQRVADPKNPKTWKTLSRSLRF